MTEAADRRSGAVVAAAETGGDGQLRGNMGTLKLILTVLAVSAPLGAVAGVVPIVIAAGNGIGAPGTYLMIGVILLLFAVGFTTMTRHIPRAGAFYAYVTAGLGRPLGLGAAFVAQFGYLTLLLGAYGFLGIAFNALLVSYGVASVPWWVYSLAALLAVTVLGHFNVEVSGRVLAILMVLEVLIVLALDVPVLVQGGPEGWSLESFTPGAFTSGSVALAILFASATFVGFEATAIYRSEVRDPRRTVPRATYLAVTLIAAFYVLTAWALITAFGSSAVVGLAQEDPTTLFSNAIGARFGSAAQQVLAVLLVTSVFASVLSSHNPIARYVFSLGRDGAFPSVLGRSHRRHGSPAHASLVTSVVAVLVALPFVVSGLDPVSFFSWMFGIGALGLLACMALTCLAVIVFFRRKPAPEPIWNTLIAPGLGFIGLVVMLVIVSSRFSLLIGGSTTLSVVFQLVLLGLAVLGVVLARVWARTRPETYARIGGQEDHDATAATSDRTSTVTAT
ncbi:APC family permease [Modestobacter sp. URMC 112]